MKKHVRHFFFLIIFALIVGNAYGQAGPTLAGAWISGSSNRSVGTRVFTNGSNNYIQQHDSPLQLDSDFHYYDPTMPRHSWPLESNWGSFEMFGISERITLPSDSGYVDSITILFDGISDTVRVLLVSDTLYATSVGVFHLINGFDPASAIYGMNMIIPSLNSADSFVTVNFPHVSVPKEFHVLVVPSINSRIAPQFSIVGDSEDTRLRTSDNCRSNFIGIALPNEELFVEALDSVLVPSGDAEPLFSNMNITAFVSENPDGATNETQYIGIIAAIEAPFSAVAEVITSAENVVLFPNPASATINISCPDNVSTMEAEIVDLLGRTVLSAQINGNGKLDVSQLQPGRYEAIVHSAIGVMTAPVIIQR